MNAFLIALAIGLAILDGTCFAALKSARAPEVVPADMLAATSSSALMPALVR
jgi:hypothetical protein